MNKIAEYHAVTANGDIKDLNVEVNRMIKKGFQPFGEVSTCVDSDTVYFTQVMVSYETSADKAPGGI